MAHSALNPLTIDLLDDADTFNRLKPLWQVLEAKDPHCSPFNTWDWLSLWWSHYAVDPLWQLAIIIVRRANRVVAIAPLYSRREKTAGLLNVNVMRFIGTGGDTSPDYLNFICEPLERIFAEEAIVNYLFEHSAWQKLLLTDVLAESSLSRCLASAFARNSGYTAPKLARTIQRAELPDSWEAYRRALSRKRRKQINHRQNRLDSAGESELSLCASRQEMQEAVDALIELHRLRWQSKGLTGGFQSREYVAFHRAVIERFFSRDALWLATLKLNGQIIGVQYIFLWRGKLLYFQSGYSPEHENLSPGHVLFTYTIQRAIEQGVQAIDMLKGDYHYKNVYARQGIETCDHEFVRSGINALVRMGRGWGRRLNKLRTPQEIS